MVRVLSENDDHCLVAEDDGVSIYAYLIDVADGDNTIVADLWLANRGPAPQSEPWKTEDANPPFANPAAFLDGAELQACPEIDEYSAIWDGEEGCFVILAKGEAIGVLGAGDKPGWSRCVGSDGPLALVWITN